MIEVILDSGVIANGANADRDVIAAIPRIRGVVATPVAVCDGGTYIDPAGFTISMTNTHAINIANASGGALAAGDIVTVLVEQTGDLTR